MTGESVSLLAAVLAGLVSFVSPCVLPIVPGYLSFISGVNLARLRDAEAAPALTRRVALTSLFFVLGFSTVFVVLGAAATAVGELLQSHKRALGIVGGAVIIVLGLHMAGLVKIDWLLAEKRAAVRERPLGLLGAYVVGLAFAFGWTPCIGPILGAILLFASQQETIAQGVMLLAAYSAGLGIPFVLSALAVNGFFRAFGRLRGSMRAIEVTAGVMLVGVGVLLVTDRLTLIAQYVTKAFPGLATLG
ncbi:MAG TPA: cytochrome c biogenesis protein CcdA [Vicinamibacteria bacterium]|nr:cytochrome c biogenesis protein CcdA [Vicinamibacteria bacterium]